MGALVMQNVALGKGGVRKLRGCHPSVIPPQEPVMHQRNLGTLAVSAIGYGCMGLDSG